MNETITPYFPGKAAVMPQYVVSSNGSGPKTFGVDVSRYQTDPDYGNTVNYLQCFADGVKFCAIRCTVGDYYSDPFFAEFWDGFHDAGILRTAYIVVAPAWSKEYNYKPVSALAHWEKFLNTFEDRIPDYPIVLDCELVRNQTAAYISELINDLIWLINEKFGRMPIIYTRGAWWNTNTISKTSFGLCDLWIARYNEAIDHPWADNPVYKPRDWDEWLFWQKVEEGTIAGIPDSHVSFDYFNGTLEDLLVYADSVPEPDPDPDPDPEIIARLDELDERLTEVEAVVYTLANDIEDLQARVTAVENADDDDPDPLPDPDPTAVTARITDATGTVAFAQSGENANGVPIIDANAFAEFDDPLLKFDFKQLVQVLPKAVSAQGGSKWFQLSGVPLHGYPALYVDKSKAMKV